MSSAANNKRGDLEREFQRRMHEAEASPSADLWNRIDHQLTMQENSHYKKGMLFYRQLAAACAAVILLAGGFGAYYLGNESPAGSVAQVQPASKAASMAAVPDAELPQTAPVTEEAIASAMQQAVQEPEAESIVAAVPAAKSIKAKGAQPVVPLESPASVVKEQSIALAADTEPGLKTDLISSPDPTEWRIKAEPKYKSVFDGSGSIAAERLFSGFQDARSSLFGTPLNSGFSAASQQRTAFAGVNPAEASEEFKKLNELVVGRVKELQREQEAMLQAYNNQKEALSAKDKEDTEKRGGSRWSLGMAYVPSYFEQNIDIPAQTTSGMTYSSFAPNLTNLRDTNNSMAEAREEYKEEIEPGFSFGVEVKTGFKLGKKWKLLSGLGFTQNTARSKSSYVIEQFQQDPNTTERVSEGPTTIFLSSLGNNFMADSMSVAKTDGYDVNYRYRHLTVPVGVQYEGNLSKDWFWFAGGGVAANILIESAVLASNAEVRDSEYELSDDASPFRKLLWSGNVTAGVGKRLSNSVSVAVGPAFRGYLNSMLANPSQTQSSQSRPYNIGLNMAVNYDLGSR